MDILSSVNVIRKDLHQRDIKGRGKVPRNDFICTLLRAGGEMSQVEMLADQFLVDLESGGPACVDYQAFIAHLEDVMREGSRASSSSTTTSSKRAAPFMSSTSPSNNGGMSLSPDGFDASSVPSPSVPRRGPSVGRRSFEDVEASCSPATPASPPHIQSTPVHLPPTPRSPDVMVHTLDKDDDLDYVLSPLTPSVVKRAAMRTITSERLSPSSPFASTRAATSDALLPVTRSITPQYSPDTLTTSRGAVLHHRHHDDEEASYSARPQRRGLAAPPVTMPMPASPQPSWHSGSSASPVPASPHDHHHTTSSRTAIPTDFESALRYARSVSMTSDQDASPPAALTPPAHHHQVQPMRRQETMPYPSATSTYADPTPTTTMTPLVDEEQVPLRVVFAALVKEGREGLLQCRAFCVAAVKHRIPVGTEELEALFESVGDQGQGIGFADFCLLVSRLRPEAIRVLRRASLWGDGGETTKRVSTTNQHAPCPPLSAEEATTPVSPWNCGVEEVVQQDNHHTATTPTPTTALESVLLDDSVPLPPPPFISRSPPSTNNATTSATSSVTREPPLPFEQPMRQDNSPPPPTTNTNTHHRSMPSYMSEVDHHHDASPSSSPSPPRHHGNFQLPVPTTSKKVALTPRVATTTSPVATSDVRPVNKDRLTSRLYMPTASSRSKTRSGSAPKTAERIRSSSIADRAPAVSTKHNTSTTKVVSTIPPPRPLLSNKTANRAAPRKKTTTTTTTSKSRSLDTSCNCSESEDVDAIHVQLRSSSNGSHTAGRTYVAHREPLPTKASSARSLEPRHAPHQRSMSTAASDRYASSMSPQPTPTTPYTPPAELVAEVCAVVLEDCSRRDKKRQGWVETGFVRKVVAAAVNMAVDSNEYGGPSTGRHRPLILSHCLHPITAFPKGSGGTDYIGFISALVAASKEPTPSPARSDPPPHPAPIEHLSPFTRQLLAAREKMRKVILLELEGLLGIQGNLPILTAMSAHFELHDVRRSGYVDEKILRKSIVQLCHQGAMEVGGGGGGPPAWLVQRCVKLSREPFDALVGGVSHRQDRDLHAAVSGASHMLESYRLDPSGREAASLCDYRYLLRILGL